MIQSSQRLPKGPDLFQVLGQGFLSNLFQRKVEELGQLYRLFQRGLLPPILNQMIGRRMEPQHNRNAALGKPSPLSVLLQRLTEGFVKVHACTIGSTFNGVMAPAFFRARQG